MGKEYYGTFVIGNGFDLEIGYDTRYSDFYASYAKVLSQYDGKTVLEKCSDEDAKNKYIKLVKELADNFFVKYTLGTKKIFGNWCSFERELGEIIETLDYCFDSLIPSNVLCNQFSIDLSNNNKPLNLNIFNNEVIGSWKGFELNAQSSRNRKVCIMDTTHREEINLTNDKVIKDDFKNRFIDNLYNDLLDYQKLFILYLKTFVESRDPIKKPNVGAIMIFSYNYTRCPLFPDDPIIYLHGSTSENRIVLGIDDSIDLKNDQFIVFKKMAQRSLLETNNVIDSLLSGGDNRIAYYGLSFDGSDSHTLLMMLSKKNKVHHFYYHGSDPKAKRSIVINLIKLLGYDTYSKMYDGGFINFINSEEAF